MANKSLKHRLAIHSIQRCDFCDNIKTHVMVVSVETEQGPDQINICPDCCGVLWEHLARYVDSDYLKAIQETVKAYQNGK